MGGRRDRRAARGRPPPQDPRRGKGAAERPNPRRGRRGGRRPPPGAGPRPAALAEPTATPKGAVVVIQEAFGLTPHIVSITERLAAAGWLAVAPALFHRQGSPVLAYEGDFAKIGPLFEQLTVDTINMDVDAAL